jgi:hypothetical protein
MVSAVMLSALPREAHGVCCHVVSTATWGPWCLLSCYQHCYVRPMVSAVLLSALPRAAQGHRNQNLQWEFSNVHRCGLSRGTSRVTSLLLGGPEFRFSFCESVPCNVTWRHMKLGKSKQFCQCVYRHVRQLSCYWHPPPPPFPSSLSCRIIRRGPTASAISHG